MLRRTVFAVVITLVCSLAVHAQGNEQTQITVTAVPDFPGYIEGMSVKFDALLTRTKNGKDLPINMANKVVLATFPDKNTYVTLVAIPRDDDKLEFKFDTVLQVPPEEQTLTVQLRNVNKDNSNAVKGQLKSIANLEAQIQKKTEELNNLKLTPGQIIKIKQQIDNFKEKIKIHVKNIEKITSPPVEGFKTITVYPKPNISIIEPEDESHIRRWLEVKVKSTSPFPGHAELYFDNKIQSSQDFPAGDFSFSPFDTKGTYEDDEYYVQVILELTDFGNYKINSPIIRVTIDNTPPTIESMSPKDGDTTEEPIQSISVSYKDFPSRVETKKVTLIVNNVDVTNDCNEAAHEKRPI